jgi:disks large-associated protein 5
MSSSHFASCLRKNLSTEMIRSKISYRKSLSQKENRHKEYEQNRNFGLKDVKISFLESRVLVNIHETLPNLITKKPNIKPRSKKTIESDQ